MLRLEHEIIFFVGLQQSGDLLSAHTVFEQMVELLPEVRAPFAKIVIDVDRRDFRFLRALFESGQVAGSRKCIAKQRLAGVELHVVDNVDQDQRDRRFVRYITVQIIVLRWHDSYKWKGYATKSAGGWRPTAGRWRLYDAAVSSSLGLSRRVARKKKKNGRPTAISTNPAADSTGVADRLLMTSQAAKRTKTAGSTG